MINQFLKCWYNRSLIEQQIDKANLEEKEQILKEKKKDTATTIPHRSNVTEYSLK